MYTINTHTNNILQFTNSLVIHLPFVGVQINNNLFTQYQDDTIYNEYNKQEWKYYLNLNGEYHKTDTDIFIRLLSEDKKVKFDKSLLVTYPNIKKELLKYGDYYRELINNYPLQEALIKGILHPVDTNTSINSEIGTILNYNKDIIAVYEVDLITELESYIKGFINKWINPLYSIVDEYYLSYKLSILYTSIVLKVYNIRLNNIKTDKVHDFFLEEAFKSHKYLHNDVSVLSREVKLWLYRNLPYIDTHIGKNKTLQSIIDNVYEKMHVGVGELTLQDSVISSSMNIDNLYKPVTPEKDILVKSKALNSSYDKKDNTITPVVDLLTRELSLDIIDKSERDWYVDYYKKQLIERNRNRNTKTKVLELDVTEDITFNPYDKLGVVIDAWVYTSFNKNYTAVETFIDPNNNKEYNLTADDGVMLLFKLIQDLYGYKDIIITSYTPTTLYKDNYTIAIDNLISKTQIKSVVSKLQSNYPVRPIYFKDSSDFYNYISDIMKFDTLLWTYSSNIQNMVISADLKNIRLDMLQLDKITFNDNKLTLDDYLVSKNINFIKNSGYDIMASIYELLKTFTKLDLGNKELLEEKVKKYVNILTKLTSYTIQVLPSVDDKHKEHGAYNTLSTNKDITLLELEEGKFKCLEDLNGEHRVEVYEDLSDDNNSKLSAISINPIVNLKTDKILPKPILYMYNQDDSITLRVTKERYKQLALFKPTIVSAECYPDVKEDIVFTGITPYKKQYAEITTMLEYKNIIYDGLILKIKK